MKKMLSQAFVFILIATVFAACGSNNNTNNENTNINNSGEKPQINKGEEIELVFWDHATSEEDNELFQTLVDQFLEDHPNVKIKRSSMKVQDMQQIIRPALTSGEGPDMFYYTPGPGYVGVLAEAGLLTDLSPFADQYEWHDKFPKWIMDQGIYNENLYSVGNQIDVLGVYYNKTIFNELDVDVPKTYDEFLMISSKLKAEGITPLILDDRDQWPGFHLESIFLNASAGKEEIEKVLEKEAKFTQPVFAKGLNEFYNLISQKYTNENLLSLSYDDGNREFYAGNGAMRITGSWLAKEMSEKMGDEVGLFMFPMIDSSLPHTAPGGIGNTMVVSKHSKHPEIVAEFIDFMYSEETASLWYEGGIIPPVKGNTENANLSDVFKDVINAANNPNGLSYNLDVLMPQTVNEVAKSKMQELIAGRITGEEALEAKQKALDKAIAEGNY